MDSRKTKHLWVTVIALALCVGGLATYRALAFTTIASGYDQFNTPNDGVTGENWGALPAGFFTNAQNVGSNAVGAQTVNFKGGNPVPGFNGDTVIDRTQDVTVPGTTPLVVTGLRFVGTTQVTATFPSGTSPVTYNVVLKESTVTSTGSMTFNADGTYSSTLTINRQYTFIPTDSSQPTKVADSTNTYDGNGNLVFPKLDLSGTGTWSAGGGGGLARGSIGPEAIASAVSVQIFPNTEQGALASHGIAPAPSPSPSPTPVPTKTVVPVNTQ